MLPSPAARITHMNMVPPIPSANQPQCSWQGPASMLGTRGSAKCTDRDMFDLNQNEEETVVYCFKVTLKLTSALKRIDAFKDAWPSLLGDVQPVGFIREKSNVIFRQLFTDAGQYAIRFGDAGQSRKFGLVADIEELHVVRQLTLPKGLWLLLLRCLWIVTNFLGDGAGGFLFLLPQSRHIRTTIFSSQ